VLAIYPSKGPSARRLSVSIPSSSPHNSTTSSLIKKSFRCSSYVVINVCIRDWCWRYGDSSDQILTSYTICSKVAQWNISLIHAVKPTSDVTVNLTAVAKTPKLVSEPTFLRYGLYGGLHRILLVTVNVRLSGAGHEGACCRRRTTFAAFMPHWDEWSASLSGRFTHLLNPPPGKIFRTHGKGWWGPKRRSGRFGEGKTFFPLPRIDPRIVQPSSLHVYIIT
jgi:hypothetical protein